MQVPNSEAPLISVIIPVYNVEKYLEKCLDTVLSQTYTNIEVILVNDGSSDGSGAIIDSYACKDERVRVIHLPENKGVSYARNRGIDILKGEYTIFVDADDYVEPDFLEKLYVNLKENQADISICGVDFVGFGEYTNSRNNNFSCVVSADQAILCMLNLYPFGQEMCNKLFISAQVRKCHFAENIYSGEDLLFIYQVLKHAKCVSYMPEKLYHYVYHKESASHQEFSAKQYTGFLVYEFLFEDTSEVLYSQLYPMLISKIRLNILYINIRFSIKVIESNSICNSQKYRYLKRFQKNIRRFINRKTLTLIERKSIIVKIFLLYGNVIVFWLSAVIYKTFKGFWLRCRKINN